MTRNNLKTLDKKTSYRIARSKFDVFVRTDFRDLADYDQVGRSLRHLVAWGVLLKLGYGLYAKAATSPLSGRLVPRVGISEVAQQALEKLGVERVPSSYERAYNEGRSTQVPTGRVVGVRGRISRKVGYNGNFVTFERAAA